jgi:hypothetical protein
MNNLIAYALSLTLVALGFAFRACDRSGRATNPAIASLPTDKTETIPSPDKQWALIATPIPERTLTLENWTSHQQTLIKEYSRSLAVGWSPDSQAFFVNDEYVSNLADAWIYWVDLKAPVSLNDAILAADPEAKAMAADHAYFLAGAWLTARKLRVEYCGHGGKSPGRQFDFIYEASLSGSHGSSPTIRRVSHRVRPMKLSTPDCSL